MMVVRRHHLKNGETSHEVIEAPLETISSTVMISPLQLWVGWPFSDHPTSAVGQYRYAEILPCVYRRNRNSPRTLSFADKIACEKIIHPHLCDGTPKCNALHSPEDSRESIADLFDVSSWDREVQKMVQCKKSISPVSATVPLQLLRTIPMYRILPRFHELISDPFDTILWDRVVQQFRWVVQRNCWGNVTRNSRRYYFRPCEPRKCIVLSQRFH